MAPWDVASGRLLETLAGWLGAYSRDLCGDEVNLNEPRSIAYLCRLWRCWSHHWRRAADRIGQPVDGHQVAESLIRRQGEQSHLASDPLRDVVLAEAVLQRDPQATETFQSSFEQIISSKFARSDRQWNDFANQLAGYYSDKRESKETDHWEGAEGLLQWLALIGRTVLQLNDGDDATFASRQQSHLLENDGEATLAAWNEGLPRLRGYVTPRGGLASFHGQAGIGSWLLYPTAQNFFWKKDSRRDKNTGALIEESVSGDLDDVDFRLISEECQERLRDIFRRAIALILDRGRPQRSALSDRVQQAVEQAERQSSGLQPAPFAASSRASTEASKLMVMLLMKHEQGLSNRQIAAVTGVHPANIGRPLEFAETLFREMLNELRHSNPSGCYDALSKHDLGSVVLSALGQVAGEASDG